MAIMKGSEALRVSREGDSASRVEPLERRAKPNRRVNPMVRCLGSTAAGFGDRMPDQENASCLRLFIPKKNPGLTRPRH